MKNLVIIKLVIATILMSSISCSNSTKKNDAQINGKKTDSYLVDNPYYDLLKEWCDGMINYQITQPMGEGLSVG